jgi:hypothetical protein
VRNHVVRLFIGRNFYPASVDVGSTFAIRDTGVNIDFQLFIVIVDAALAE